MPNKLSQFWQELKRRKVIRTITVYAASAFVILELLSIIIEPLKLPEWTLQFAIVFLCIAFIVAVILSWIYDIHPEGGVVKTEPAHQIKKQDIPKASSSWKIASYMSFVVIVGLIVLNIIPRAGKKEILDKSIAVLPFRNDSPEQERMYFINGTMEAILDNLCKIEDLRVPGRTSVEQYRDNPKPIPVVAEELKVSYVLEGSGHRDGNRVRLFIQLLDGKNDKHIWSKSYDADVEDIFNMQSEIAQLVASEIKAIITPEEKALIENVPTTSLTALDFYQEGRDNHWKFWLNGDTLALQRAEELYNKALKADPTYAQAYGGLAWTYWNKHGSEEYLTEGYLDSVLILTDMALSHNRNISETHVIRGRYYVSRNYPEQAIIELDKALRINPNEWLAYVVKANLYSNIDFLLTIENLHKGISLHKGQYFSNLLRNLSQAYSIIGFFNHGKKYAQQYLELTGDSARFIFLRSGFDHLAERIEILQKAYRLDSGYQEVIYQIGESYSFLGKHEESLKYFDKCLNLGGVYSNRYHRIGYAYWHNGDKEKAEYYFDKQIEYSLAEINLGRKQAGVYLSYYDLAGTYFFRGEKSKAYEYLNMFNQKERMPIWMIDLIKSDPLFESVRDESEFQQIVRDVEAKYQAEHERVRLWLEENDLL